jgi:hypothetical protein
MSRRADHSFSPSLAVPERNRHFAEMDDVAVAEIDACADARAADERAVGALQIFDRGGTSANHEPGVPARDAGDVHPDPAAGVAAENRLAGRQHHGLVADDQPEAGVGDRRSRFFRIFYIGDERVAPPVRGPDEPRRVGRIAQRTPDLGDDDRQAGVRDMGIGPDACRDRLLVDHVRPMLEQELQHLEGLGGKRNLAAVGQELLAAAVDSKRRESDPHTGLLKICTFL